MPMQTIKPHADPHAITSLPQLEALFGNVGDASLKKEVNFLHPAYQALIQASPFAVLATAGPGGLDASPRGDQPGFVAIQDDKTLLLPERRGNNRIDSLRNLLADPRVALLFLIPGVGETLRVNGRARITVAPDMLQRFSEDLSALQRAIRWGKGDELFDLFTRTRAVRRSIVEQGQDDDAADFGRAHD